MIKEADALKAVDEAFADGVKKLFGVLVTNAIDGSTTAERAADRFSVGFAIHCHVHQAATAIVERHFNGTVSDQG